VEPHYLKYLAGGQDKEAVLADLMNQYGNDVWNFAFFLTRRSDAADDLSQEVFLAVYDTLFNFRGESSVKSWLLTITHNKSLKFLQSAFIRKVSLVEYILPKNHARSAEEELFDRMETKRIWNKVMELPRKFREVIILDVHYQLSIQEMNRAAGMRA